MHHGGQLPRAARVLLRHVEARAGAAVAGPLTLAHMGAADDKTVIAVFETNDADEFARIFNDPATAEAMSEDKITGGVEMFILDETFKP